MFSLLTTASHVHSHVQMLFPILWCVAVCLVDI
ncbi:unnamed protein product [Schistosoma curassoni]|uniref:Uncharacterized protein n=1 Tax=Schistosoma curassoni TaxID=6186 RepID=A0A183JBJ1_9TREM|nr:unnamed protein product [Schistosoma curassoni]